MGKVVCACLHCLLTSSLAILAGIHSIVRWPQQIAHAGNSACMHMAHKCHQNVKEEGPGNTPECFFLEKKNHHKYFISSKYNSTVTGDNSVVSQN